MVSALRALGRANIHTMRTTLYKVLAVGFAIGTLTSCQKEISSGRLELVAEGIHGGGNKMYVAGKASYWLTGDSVNINGEEATITASETSAQVDGVFSAEEYYIVSPSSIYQSRAGNIVTVDMPAVYHYSSTNIGGVFRQKLDAPMAYYGTAEGGKVMMRHLTGALNLQITAPSGMLINRIAISTTQNHVLNGPMQFDLSDLENIGSSSTGTSSAANTVIEMQLDGISINTVQIPVPVLAGNVNFVIRVEGSIKGTKYTFERTQTTGGHLGRNVMATVPVDLTPGGEGVTTSALFPTTVRDDFNTYYEIRTAQDLMLMSQAVWGNTYREDGDTYLNRWEYNGLAYKDANYLIMNDIDMSGYAFTSITGFCGIFNGNGHTISNMTVTGSQYHREYSHLAYNTQFGVFALLELASPHICNVTFSNLTLKANSYMYGTEYQDNYIGGLFGYCSTGTSVENVHITNLTVVNRPGTGNTWGRFYLGGLFGRTSGPGSIAVNNSSVSFAPNQAFCSQEGRHAYIGGIAGYGSELTCSNVSIDFGTMSRSSQTQFGGISGYNNYTASFTNTSIIGNITITNGTAGKIYPYTDTMEGVNTDGLTINH